MHSFIAGYSSLSPPALPGPPPPQPWISGALVFYAVLAVYVIVTRKMWAVQVGTFFAVCSAVFMAQYLNGFLAQNWKELGFSQNYFDDRGVFISALYSTPLLLVAFFQMVRLIAQSAGERGDAETHARLETLSADVGAQTGNLACRDLKPRLAAMSAVESARFPMRQHVIFKRESGPVAALPTRAAPPADARLPLVGLAPHHGQAPRAARAHARRRRRRRHVCCRRGGRRRPRRSRRRGARDGRDGAAAALKAAFKSRGRAHSMYM